MSQKVRLLTREDVLSITDFQCPMLVVSENPYALLSLLIRLAQGKIPESHVMWLYKPGYLASQDMPFYHSVPITKYLDKYRLTFYYGGKWKIADKETAKCMIEDRLGLPPHRRLYDWLGLVGQLLRKVWINVPWLYYCSEEVSSVLRYLSPTFYNKHPSIKDILSWGRQTGELSVYGHYDPYLSNYEVSQRKSVILKNV